MLFDDGTEGDIDGFWTYQQFGRIAVLHDRDGFAGIRNEMGSVVKEVRYREQSPCSG